MSIIVCGDDFSLNLAHKDLLEMLYLQVPDDYFCSDIRFCAFFFHIYCVHGEPGCCVSPPRVGAVGRGLL